MSTGSRGVVLEPALKQWEGLSPMDCSSASKAVTPQVAVSRQTVSRQGSGFSSVSWHTGTRNESRDSVTAQWALVRCWAIQNHSSAGVSSSQGWHCNCTARDAQWLSWHGAVASICCCGHCHCLCLPAASAPAVMDMVTFDAAAANAATPSTTVLGFQEESLGVGY